MGYDQNFTQYQKLFFYLPFEHSESLKDQKRSVQLFKNPKDSNFLKWAIPHHDIIAHFVRFPYRYKKILGRKCTPEEIVFFRRINLSF